MSEVFVSYARSSEAQAKQVAEALRTSGYGVWLDDDLPAHRSYSDVIEEQLKSAKAVVVIWSADAAKSQWVRAEADAAREAGTLVQVSMDGSVPPLPFNQIQCANLGDWDGDVDAPGWRKVAGSISALAGPRTSAVAETGPARSRCSVCVLPFVNMSGEAEQEYFSDGISEDIITDLSKVSALSVTARHTAFAFKGKSVRVPQVARELNVTHVLEGSVRKAGSRVRITAQLIDGAAGDHLWAERYDRDLTNIFAIQDEISAAIVKALKLKLLPEEKKAIENRGTHSADAYDLYLMARQYWVSGNDGDGRRDEIILRICRQATDLDPNYAQAWALMALAQMVLRFRHGKAVDDGMAAAERALALDPKLAEAHAIKARYLSDEGRHKEANVEIETALQLDPESWEVNREAARLTFKEGRIDEAAQYFRKATELMDTDYYDPGLLVVCYTALGDIEKAKSAAEITVARAERALARDPSNGAALGHGAYSLACLGESERAKQWMNRALLVDPENPIMRYNLACALTTQLKDHEAALEMLEPYLATATLSQVTYTEADPDMDGIRDDPRFQALIAAARRRASAGDGAAA